MKIQSFNVNLDFIGMSTSLLCAIHCAGLPFLLSLAPLAGLQFLSTPWIEYTIIFTSFIIASYSLVHGYRRHHQKPLAMIIFTIGFILICTGHLLHGEWKEALATSFGAIIIASAHFINWRQVKQSDIKFPDCLRHDKSTK